MQDQTKTLVTALATGVIKKVLIIGGTWAATHGLISGVSVETYSGIAVAAVAASTSLWQDYGKAIVLSQLDVLKARSLAAAAKIHAAGLPPVTPAEIAAKSPTLTTESVTKIAQTMAPDIKASVLPVAALKA